MMAERYDVTAVVPLGGSGTRIYPLTLRTPKHMVPIANRALFHAAGEHWANQGIRDFIFCATGYENRVQTFDFFGHGGRLKTPNSPGGAKTYYATYEDRDYKDDKKGSADVFFWALDRYETIMNDNHILLINGDNLSNTSLRDFYDFHVEKDALLTIAVKGLDIEDPLLREFGTVVFDDKTMQCRDFVEKSQNPVSRYANTAICLFSRRIRDVVRCDEMKRAMAERGANGRKDVGMHLIPSLIDIKEAVYAFPLSGKWSDVGNPHSYRATSDDIKHGEYPHIRLSDYERVGNSWVHTTTKELMGKKLSKVNLEGTCIIGSNVEIGENATIINSVVGPNVTVERGAHVTGGSTLFPFARVGDNSRLSNVIVCKNTTIGRNSVVRNGAIIGDDLCLPDGFEVGTDWRIASADYRARIEAAKYKVAEDMPEFGAIRFA